MTLQQRLYARYALGLPNTARLSYSKHYVCGPNGESFVDWTDMVAQGFAQTDGPKPYLNGASCFILTLAGAYAALEPGEALDKEDFPVAAEAAE